MNTLSNLGSAPAEFEKAFFQEVAETIGRVTKVFVSEENIQAFHHGTQWTYVQQTNEGPLQKEGNMQAESIELRFPNDRILERDLSIIEEYLQEVAAKQEAAMVRRLSLLVRESQSEKIEVNINSGSLREFADRHLRILDKLGFSVDANGEPVPPQMLVGDEMYIEKLKRAVAEIPEFESQINEMVERKKKEALDEEAARIAKYPVC